MTSSQMLAHIGTALFRERWPKPLANALNRHNRQVWRWINGESEPDREVFLALADLLNRRMRELNDISHDLESWLASSRESGE